MQEDLRTKDEEQAQDSTEFRLLIEMEQNELEKIFAQWESRFEAADAFMKKLHPSMIESYKQYRSVADPILDPDTGKEVLDRANLVIPYAFAIVESEMPRLAGRLPRAHAFPKKPDVPEHKIKAIQDLIYYGLDRMNFIELQTLWLRQHAIYGWSVLFYFWRHETRKILEKVEIPLQDGSTAKDLRKVEKTIYDDFWARVLDVFDCFPQPGCGKMEESDWFMFREWFSAKDLRRMAKTGLFYPEVEKYLDEHPTPTTGKEGSDGRRERDEVAGLESSNEDHTYGKFELMWTLEDERVVLVLDRAMVAAVRDNPHPFQQKPIINCVLTPLISEPIGIGTIEALAGLPARLNALSNARLDNIALLLNRVFLVQRNDKQIDYKNIRFSPGNVILVGDIDKSIKALEIPDTSTSSEREVNTTMEMMQFVSGISDYIAGTATQSQLADTATGISTIVREANARFALKLSAFESGSLRDLIYNMHLYQFTYMEEDRMIYVLGPKGYITKTISVDDIAIESDFIVEPGSTVPLDQLARRESLLNLFDRLKTFPQLVRLDKIIKELLEAHDIRNVEEFLVASEGELTANEDVKLAEAENIALSQGQFLPPIGNDGLHLGVHQSAPQNERDPVAQRAYIDHITRHQEKLALLQQQQQAAMMGGPGGGLPNAAPVGGAPAGPGPGPGGGIPRPAPPGAAMPAPGAGPLLQQGGI